jgi:hypothetical protein
MGEKENRRKSMRRRERGDKDSEKREEEIEESK